MQYKCTYFEFEISLLFFCLTWISKACIKAAVKAGMSGETAAGMHYFVLIKKYIEKKEKNKFRAPLSV